MTHFLSMCDMIHHVTSKGSIIHTKIDLENMTIGVEEHIQNTIFNDGTQAHYSMTNGLHNGREIFTFPSLILCLQME